jgi:biopolymer transport protein ExbB/TolQ
VSGTQIENVIFHLSNALRIPVLIATLVALAVVLIELGALVVERTRRRNRKAVAVRAAAEAAREAIDRGDRNDAALSLAKIARSNAMWAALEALLASTPPDAKTENQMAKILADFDLDSMRRLERTRMLVRFGPALGLMGTLIPLSPALTGLAAGNVEQLTKNLRVAFSVTVLGLLIGAIAFSISLVRDRMYAQDLSDLEVAAAELAHDPALLPVESRQQEGQLV